VSRFQFVADFCTTYAHIGGVKRLCELVKIERSSYYAWKAGAPARAARARLRTSSSSSGSGWPTNRTTR